MNASTGNMTANTQPTEATNVAQPAKNLNVESDNNGSTAEPTGQSTDPAALMTNFAVTEQPVDDTHNPVTTTLTSKFTWAIHYTDESGKKLLPDSVITHDYTRTDTGNQMGNWVYVPDSVKVTGTSNTGYNINKPDFKFNQAAGKTTFDFATWQAAAASIDGYTPNHNSVAITDQLPKNPESLHATSTVDSGTHEFTFVYTKQPTKVTINYVDDEQGEKVVGTGTVSGKTGAEVTITPQLPKGYMLTPDKDVPSTYTVTDDANQAVTIHVQKQFVDLSDTDPQAKQTRTITLHYVYGAGNKQGQHAFDDAVLDVYYHRTATLNRATSQTTYGDWMWDQSQGDPSTPGYHLVSGKWTNLPQTWANVTANVPSIKGYHADLGQKDPTNTNHVPANTWVFPTYNNAGGGGHTIAGHGATAYLNGYGYEVGPIHTIKYMPNQTTITVNYVDDDNGKAVVGHQSWNGTTGQHIDLTLTPPDNYVLTPGWVNPTSYDFDGTNSSWYTVHVKHKTQDVTDQQPKDQVTKVTRLTRNHLYGDGPHKGEKFAEPDIFDLAWKRTATKDLVTNKVTFGDWQVNWDDSKSVQGRLTARSVPYQSVDGMMYTSKNGYSYLGDNAHSEFVRADGSVKVNGGATYGWRGTFELESYPVLNYYYGPGQVNIPVIYVDADTGQKVAQKINNEALTGDDFRDGNTVTLDQTKLTSLPTTLTGYQLLPGQTLPTSYKIDTFAGVKAIEVQVVKDRSVKITFVDDDNKGAVVGTPTTITGHTGGDPVALNLTVPDKYELADGQQLPTSYTFTKGSKDVAVHLKHQRNTTQEEKTVTRKVTITTPDDKSTVTNQTVTFTRNATVDEVTGNVTYGPWSENGKYEFATVDVPNVPGYTATGDVPSLTVTPDSKDTDVTINYTVNDQTTQVVFVDDDDNGETVDHEDVHGKTGETQKVTDLPENYELANGQGDTITFTANTPAETTVHLKHKVVTKQLKINTNVFLQRFIKVSYDTRSYNEGYSTWITDDEFNDGYVAWENDDYDNFKLNEFLFGKPTDAGSVTGSVQYDLVSGEIVKVNNGETLKLGKTLFNYPSYDDVANGGSLAPGNLNNSPTKITLTNELNEITRENLNYKVYASANLTKDLLTNDEVYESDSNTNNLLPFTFENGKQYGSDYEVDTSTINNSFSVNFNDLVNGIASYGIHANDDGSLSADTYFIMPIGYQPYISKTVTRTINVTNPDKTVKTIKQTAEINQNVGEKFDWEGHHGSYLRKGEAYVTDNNWSTYEVPNIPGYTASQAQVNAVEVNGDTTDQTVNITYTANPQTAHINYVDAQGKLIHTTTVNGQTDQTVEVPNEVPDGWMLYSGQNIPKSITFQAVNNDRDYVVKHVQTFVLSTAPKEAGTIIEGTKTKTYPAGVSDADLNKTITRTILVKDTNGQTINTKTQTVHFVRNAIVDAVTGHVDYLSWSEDGSHIFATYIPVPKNGYTINSTKMAIVTPKNTDSTVELTYEPIPKTITVEYMTTDGKQVASQDVKADDNNQVKFVAPDGYVLATNTNTVDVSDLNDNIYRVLVRANEQTYTAGSTNIPKNVKNLTKVVTRTIVIVMPNGHRRTIKQRVTFERTATVKSDGSVVYTDYQPVGHDAFNHIFIAHRFGYNLNFSDGSKSVTRVDHVTADTPDQTIVVTYVRKNAN